MSSRRILEQLLKSGQSMMDQHAKKPIGSAHGSHKSGAGGLAGGALGMLLGSKRKSSFGGRTSKYGSLAALGSVAYKAYSHWQEQQKQQNQAKPRTVDQVPDAEVERHSQAILKALVGAAKADGHIDDRERQLIQEEIAKEPDGSSLQQWFDQELRKPLDPEDIASAAETPEMAAEMYTASVLVIDEQNYMEKAYLEELARCLKLPSELRQNLEREIRA